MLRGAAADFRAAGHEVVVLLDSRVAEIGSPIEADNILRVGSCGEAEVAFKAVAREADAVLVIAPEAEGVLESLVKAVEDSSAVSLNCKSNAIGKASNKAVLYEYLGRLGVKVPRTVLLDAGAGAVENETVALAELDFPFVVKPLEGAGCSGVSLIHGKGELAVYLEKLMRECLGAGFMAQEYVEGVSASVSLLAAGDKALAVSLNGQNVVLCGPESVSSYAGGVVPLDSPLMAEALVEAEEAVRWLHGLFGYVGVDFVLTAEGPVVVEVNPRLTTSYVGLRKVAQYNVAQAMLDASMNHEVPRNLQIKGYSCFSKVTVPRPSLAAFQACISLAEVVSPPYPLSQERQAVALLQAQGETPEKAQCTLRETEKRIRHIIGGS